MRPEKLSFCGINSFSQKAEIDFSQLLSGGIFGIFGDTGSGKTTILDSMIFALYGRVDRVRGGNGSEIINYNCEKANVAFEFSIETDGVRCIYRVEREIRRKNSAQKLALYRREGDALRCISEGVKNTNAAIQELIGLSFEDFKKCIALPQGEFAQFVKAERGERLRLISRLFDLEMYGEKLTAAVRRRLDDARSALDKKEGELLSYAGYTEEALSAMRQEQDALLAQKQELEAALLQCGAAFEKLKEDYTKGKKLYTYRRAQAELLTRSAEIEEMRKALEILPAAEKIVAAQKETERLQKELQGCRQTAESLIREKERAEQRLSSAEDSLQKADFDGRLLQLRTRRENLKLLRSDIEEKESLAKIRNTAAAAYKSAQTEASAANKATKALEAEISQLEGQLRDADGEADTETFLRSHLESALLDAEYASSEQYFSEKLDRLHADYEAEGALYADVETALRERLTHYRGLRTAPKQADAVQLWQSLQSMQAERSKIAEQKHRAELSLLQQKSQAREAEDRLQRALDQGQEAKAKMDGIAAKIKAAIGEDFGGDFNSLGRSLQRQEEETLQKKQAAEAEKASADRQLRRIELDMTRADERGNALQRQLQETMAQAEKYLQASAFADAGQAAAFYTRYGNADLKGQVEKYDKNLAEITAAIRALQAEGEIREVGEEEYAAAEKQYTDAKESADAIGKQCAVLSSRMQQFAAALEKKTTLEGERAVLLHRYSVLEKLRNLLYGNKFMEFVASEYLSEIAQAGSETLLKLTNERYFVKYDQGFLIGDNFNGGELRGVNTLSGGETFLVSLSLALALSAAIYAKSLRPIEFFFLDEGFGTLDEKLIDTVMDSLERLKNRHFSIGLISHVEELKHRIDHKIIVNAAPEGGSSSINISC